MGSREAWSRRPSLSAQSDTEAYFGQTGKSARALHVELSTLPFAPTRKRPPLCGKPMRPCAKLSLETPQRKQAVESALLPWLQAVM